VQYKKLYSEVLDEMIKFHVTASALRSIDKYGGLDNYLLKSPNVSTKG
jgi:large subunit ribosomal protein L28